MRSACASMALRLGAAKETKMLGVADLDKT